jgi:hypothetical protein
VTKIIYDWSDLSEFINDDPEDEVIFEGVTVISDEEWALIQDEDDDDTYGVAF